MDLITSTASLCNIHWLAGIVEGEGCISIDHFKRAKRNQRRTASPQLSVVMTDKDVMDKAAQILNTQVYVCKPQFPRNKIPYKIQLTGKQAAGWIMILYQFLGERRKAKAREVLSLWRNSKVKQGRPCKKFGIA